MERDNVTKVYESMQGMFQPMAPSAEAAAGRACDFWRSQQKILDSMQNFAGGWFERRHEGTRAALDSARRICTAKTPVDAFSEYQAWASGSLQRMTADGLALQREWMDIAEAMIAAPVVPAPTMVPPVGIAPAPDAQQAAE